MSQWALNFILKGIASLPLSLAQILGGLGGMMAYAFSSHFRGLFQENYRYAMQLHGKTTHPWKAAAASGMLFIDSLWIWHNPQKALSRAHIQDWSPVDQAVQEGKGLVMLTPHLGGFEIIPRILANHFPATILYRPARQEWLNHLIEEQRAYPNMHFVPTNLQGVRKMVKALQEGEAIGILPDQVPSGGDGVWVKFFNRYAYTTPLPARLANRNQTPVILFSAIRKSLGQGWIIKTQRLKAFSEDPYQAATQMNEAIEVVILEAPEQFIWSYNRYKHPEGAELPPQD
ncbi:MULTISPECIES: lysophospholipid acyltransferase family protein [unclassified Polynucleobacter]|uniref:lysophospholipid acyltransferase family protein n=1 Tax=unclassified Polynucleobacter TaxID=2640945 RepID=UPI002572920D|nr:MULTISPECIES: lysophospholipid acyltransferase family protein [unclassified Polynucleobacter]BEI36202.1 lysophospholipid acyltransferase family protein [Polynucleobacter sp. HIN6]BEI43566.1 lysophospholipid acyltransferase family protein [Polynucleobacter sp. HIN10]BEI45340.1 lysophospholipid acyltransferase family protein [Polynucleobacter sp. HIN11]